MKNISLKLIQGMLLSLVFSTAMAQSQILPNSKTLMPKNKTLIVETVSPLKIYEYSPTLEIIDLEKNKTPTFNHPESTLQAYFSAMRSLDYEAYLNCWTKSSQAFMLEKDKQYKFDAAKWKSMWAAAFVGKKIQVINWISYGKYVLIHYKVSPTANPETSETTIALTQENGEWKLTQDLRADQILTSWNNPTGRVQVPSDLMLQKHSGK